MTQELSSLMDGEMAAGEAERTILACARSEEQKATWFLYHAIGDAMRGQAPRRLEMPDEMMDSLKAQPTVLAPRRSLHLNTYQRIALAAAASVATIGVVGWIGSQGGPGGSVPAIAKSSSSLQTVGNKATVATPALDVQDYLAAHRQIPSAELYRPVNNRAPSPGR
jgi:sigma-E factor negative regulatory protein RseA